jgi:hypothetical protein
MTSQSSHACVEIMWSTRCIELCDIWNVVTHQLHPLYAQRYPSCGGAQLCLISLSPALSLIQQSAETEGSRAQNATVHSLIACMTMNCCRLELHDWR